MSILKKKKTLTADQLEDRKHHITIGVAIGLLVLGGILFFVTPFGKLTAQNMRQKIEKQIRISRTIEATPKPETPSLTLAPRSRAPAPMSVESVSSAPVQSKSIFDRLMDSVDRLAGTGMGVIGFLVALKGYLASRKTKKARAARTT